MVTIGTVGEQHALRPQQPQSDLAQRLAVLVFVALRGYAKLVSDDQVGSAHTATIGW